jgi:integrase
VFARPDGAPLHPQVISDRYDKLVESSGLPRIRLHDLRHTHATLALKASVPVKVVSERLGHASIAFTLDTYAHVLPGMQAEAAEIVAALVVERPTSVSEP